MYGVYPPDKVHLAHFKFKVCLQGPHQLKQGKTNSTNDSQEHRNINSTNDSQEQGNINTNDTQEQGKLTVPVKKQEQGNINSASENTGRRQHRQ